MRAKPRGSMKGLQKSQCEMKARNTSALLGVIADFRIEKPNTRWTYREICSRAGLRSPNALDRPWNAHIRAEIEAHNSRVRSSQLPLLETTEKATPRHEIKDLRSELTICKAQRDSALSRIAQYSADSEYLRKRCDDLQRIIDRLLREQSEATS